MECSDCPNQTDGKCCHQLIRPQGSKTMNLLDEAAWEREFDHANKVQNQNRNVRGIINSTGQPYYYDEKIKDSHYAIKDDNHEK